MQTFAPTPFLDWLQRSGRSRAQVARDIGCSKSYFSQLANGQRQPSLALAARIERLSGGAVPAASWIPDEDAA